MLMCLAPGSLCFQIPTSRKRARPLVTSPVRTTPAYWREEVAMWPVSTSFGAAIKNGLERDSRAIVKRRSYPLTELTPHIKGPPPKRWAFIGGFRPRHQGPLNYLLGRLSHGLRYLHWSYARYWKDMTVYEKRRAHAEIRARTLINIFPLKKYQ